MHEVYAGAGSIAFDASRLFSSCSVISTIGRYEQVREATSKSPAWRWWVLGTAGTKLCEHAALKGIADLQLFSRFVIS